MPKYSPKINFPSSNLSIGPDNKVSIKKVNTGITANRLLAGEKSVDMPGQVVEQWIDAVLKDEEDDPVEIDEKP